MANILHLNHRYWPVVGGSEQAVEAIAGRQAASGHDVTVFTTDAEDFSAFWDPNARRLSVNSEQHLGVNIVRTPIGYFPGKLWSFAGIRRAQVYLRQVVPLASAFGRRAPHLPELDQDLSRLGRDWDAVVDWNITFDGLAAAAQQVAAASGARFVVVPFLHLGEGPNSSVRKRYTMPHQLRLLGSADSVLVQTEVARSFLLKAGLDERRVTTLGLGIDPQAIAGGDAERFRERFKIDSPVVTAIGPLTRDKGVQQLVTAANKVRAAGYPMTLVLAGPPMPDFEKFWSALSSSEKQSVIRLGPVVGDAKNDLLAATDLLALPSRTDSFGIVLLEAWYYAKPVIGARAGGIPGLIADGQDGRLVPYDDVDALADAIVELIGDPQKAALWGANGRQKVLGSYTWDATYERFSRATGIL